MNARARRRRARRRDGFTLIEILVAMLVFLAAVTGILGLIATAVAMQRDGLALNEATRRLDALRDRLETEVAAGGHFDADGGRWVDVPPTRLSERVVYSVRFEQVGGEVGDAGPLAWVRVASSEAGLAGAEPVLLWLSARPAPVESVRRHRERDTSQR